MVMNYWSYRFQRSRLYPTHRSYWHFGRLTVGVQSRKMKYFIWFYDASCIMQKTFEGF
jgi:hypothetical protein